MTTDEIITALGGRKRVAERFGVSHRLVHSWIKRGFPAHIWPDVEAFARETGVPVTVEMLRRPLWQSRRAAIGRIGGEAERQAVA